MSDADQPPTLKEEHPSPDDERPMLKIVKGDPTPEELAALVAVISSIGSGTPAPPERRTPEWSAHHRKVRATFAPGPGGWRSSGLPR
jgi:hypothetical protein